MKRGTGERERNETKNKRLIFGSVFLIFLISLIILPFISAGFFNDFWGKITGKATDTVVLNITVGALKITHVFNATMTDISGGLSSGPSSTNIIINFTAYHGAGASNIDNSTAVMNFTQAGETTRQNTSCLNITGLGSDYMNFTCSVTMWWWDAAGTWNIDASIIDNSSNYINNASTVFQVGETTGFELSPSPLTWPDVAAGSSNTTSTNDPILLNNTGNKNISANTIQINATNLRGETTSSLALWSGNFSMSWETSGDSAPNVECAGSQMNVTAGNYANITLANLTRGNYTTNNGYEGQEQLDRKSTRLNSSHIPLSRMPSSA